MLLFPGVPLLFLFIVLIVVLHERSKEKQRRAQFQHFASAWRLNYSPDIVRGLEKQFPDFPLLREGSNRYACHFLTGFMKDLWLTSFEWHYEITWSQGGQNNHQHTQHFHFTVVMFQPSFPLKPLVIRESRFTDRIAAAFGWGDIEFESAEFSRRYHVTAPERRWAFDVLTPRAMEFLLEHRPEAVHMDHVRVMMSVDRVRTPHDILPVCDILSGLLNGIPEYARGGGGAGGGQRNGRGGPPPLKPV